MQKVMSALLVILLVFLSSCSSGKTITSTETVRVGTGSLAMVFLPNNPPNEIKVSGTEEKFLLVMQMNNLGAYPQPEDAGGNIAPEGKLYLSGFDKRIITFEAKDYGSGDKIELQRTALEGRSTINPNGGQDIITFEGTIHPDQLNVKRYDPIIMATSCFKYETVAAPQVCIDPIPYSDVKKVCTPSSVAMQNQGAPIAVTMLNVEPFASKTQFKITVKNVGGGQVFKDSYVTSCGEDSAPNTYNQDIDRVKLEIAEIAGNTLECGPYANEGSTTNSRAQSGYIRLINGEGYVVCELASSSYGDTKTPYSTPMEIRLSYTYKLTTERPMTIIKESN